MFLYIDPLKQGLKQWFPFIFVVKKEMFLYIDPLKQGLKLYRLVHSENSSACFYT